MRLFNRVAVLGLALCNISSSDGLLQQQKSNARRSIYDLTPSKALGETGGGSGITKTTNDTSESSDDGTKSHIMHEVSKHEASSDDSAKSNIMPEASKPEASDVNKLSGYVDNEGAGGYWHHAKKYRRVQTILLESPDGHSFKKFIYDDPAHTHRHYVKVAKDKNSKVEIEEGEETKSPESGDWIKIKSTTRHSRWGAPITSSQTEVKSSEIQKEFTFPQSLRGKSTGSHPNKKIGSKLRFQSGIVRKHQAETERTSDQPLIRRSDEEFTPCMGKESDSHNNVIMWKKSGYHSTMSHFRGVMKGVSDVVFGVTDKLSEAMLIVKDQMQKFCPNVE